MKFEDVKRIVGAHETLAKSLPTGPVRGLRSAAPRYSSEQIEQATIAAMHAGVVDPETAGVLSTLLSTAGPAGIPSAVIRLLEGTMANR
jgi:hypothetical protein